MQEQILLMCRQQSSQTLAGMSHSFSLMKKLGYQERNRRIYRQFLKVSVQFVLPDLKIPLEIFLFWRCLVLGS